MYDRQGTISTKCRKIAFFGRLISNMCQVDDLEKEKLFRMCVIINIVKKKI